MLTKETSSIIKKEERKNDQWTNSNFKNKEWEKDKNELFGLYLSEADPFLTGDDSADPAVFDDFIKCFEKYGSYDDYGYEFIIKYLNDLDPYYGDIKKYFLRIDKQEYIKMSEYFSQLSDKEIIIANHWKKYYPRLFK